MRKAGVLWQNFNLLSPVIHTSSIIIWIIYFRFWNVYQQLVAMLRGYLSMEHSKNTIITQWELLENEVGPERLQFSIQQVYVLQECQRHKVQATEDVLILSFFDILSECRFVEP